MPARKPSPYEEIIQVVLILGGLIAEIVVTRIYQPLDQNYFSIVSIILFFLPIGVQAYLNRGSRRTLRHHLRMLPTWMFLGPLLVATIVFSNGAFDRYPTEQKVVTVTRKLVSHGRSGPHYRIEFHSWRKPGFEKITVNHTTFDSLELGGPMQLNVHRGWLGFTWIGQVQAILLN
jgi:hypothetical protein